MLVIQALNLDSVYKSPLAGVKVLKWVFVLGAGGNHEILMLKKMMLCYDSLYEKTCHSRKTFGCT